MPEISVCIPSYNYAEYIGACIASVTSQDFDDLEIVVVDDASTDDSAAVVRALADPRIRFEQQPERVGIAANWNACIDRAVGKYVVLLHADDLLLPGMLRAEWQLFQEQPNVGMVFAAAQVVDAAGKLLEEVKPRSADFVSSSRDFFAVLSRGNFVLTPTVMARRECYAQLGAFNRQLGFTLDWEMWLRIAVHYDVAYLATPLAAYRRHDRNATRAFSMKVSDLLEEEQAIRMIFDGLPDSCADLRTLEPGALKAIADRAVGRIEALLEYGEPEPLFGYAQLAARLNASPLGLTEAPPEAAGHVLSDIAVRLLQNKIHLYDKLLAAYTAFGHDLDELSGKYHSLEAWAHELEIRNLEQERIHAQAEADLADITGFVPVRLALAVRRMLRRVFGGSAH